MTLDRGVISMITPDPAADEARRRGLRKMRTIAVGLLVLAAVVYVATRGQDGWLGFVNAGAEASMVGAMADWFAVTALFKHPLGLPIPHTALIPKRKDELGRGLQEFVGENFLQEGIIRDRVAAATISLRVGRWLSDPVNARRVVDEAAEVASIALGKVTDQHVAGFVQDALVPRFREEPISPLLGGLLDRGGPRRPAPRPGRPGRRRGGLVAGREPRARSPRSWRSGRRGGRRHGSTTRSPVASHRELVEWLVDIRRDPQHHARQALDSMLRQLAHDLLHDPDTQARTEKLKDRLLDHPQVLASSVDLWNALRRGAPGVAGRPRRAPSRRARSSSCRRSPSGWSTTPTCASASTCWPPTRRCSACRPLRRRADGRDHPHHRALGRQGGRPAHRAARRPRPAVHPDQRHHRRRPGRRAHPHAA